MKWLPIDEDAIKSGKWVVMAKMTDGVPELPCADVWIHGLDVWYLAGEPENYDIQGFTHYLELPQGEGGE